MKNTLIRKIGFAFLMLLAVCAGLFSGNFFAPSSKVFAAVDTWDGTSDTAFLGTGTESDPFILSSAEQLAGLATVINTPGTYPAATYNNATVFYELTTDVDINRAWTPIGNNTNQFKANFNGNSHTIDRLNITSGIYCGMFGYVNDNAGGAVVQNITMLRATIYRNAGTTAYAGGIAGVVGVGSIVNCSVAGTITMYSTLGSAYIGGIVGKQNEFNSSDLTLIKDCSNTATINAYGYNNEYVGGIIGYITGLTMQKCYNTATINAYRDYSYASTTFSVGGLVGESVGAYIDRSYNSGAINILGTNTAYAFYVGGIIGNARPAFLTDCYAKCSIANYTTTAINYLGGLIGKMNDAGYTPYSTITSSYSYLTSALTFTNGGNTAVGLLVGKVTESGCSIADSYFLSQGTYTSVGSNTIPNISDNSLGKSAAQMELESTFVGWDFDTVWSIGIVAPISPILIGVGNDLDDKTITYNLNGASWATGFTPIESYSIGDDPIVLPTKENLNHSGYVFGGWYDNVGLTGSPVTQTPSGATEDLEYYAKWELAVARIGTDYFASLQEAVDASQNSDLIYIVVSSLELSSAVTISDVEITILPDTMSVTITRNHLSPNFALFSIDSGTLTLSGTEDYDLTLDGENSSVTSTMPLVLVNGADAGLMISDYVSIINNSVSGIMTDNGATVTVAGGTINGNDTYAVEIISGTLTLQDNAFLADEIIYVGDNGIIEQTTALTALSPIVIVPQTYTEGKTVVHFASAGIIDESLYSLSDGTYDLFLSGNNLNIGREYTVTYYKNDGTGLTVSEIYYGTTDFNLKNFATFTWSLTGHSFTEWNAQSDGEGTNYLDGASFTMPSQDVSLYAQWEANEYMITYNYNGATGGNTELSKVVTYNTAIGALPTPTKSGYNFLGWYWEETFVTLASDSDLYLFTENKTLYADYEILSYNISVTVTTSANGGGSNGATVNPTSTIVDAGEDLVVTVTLATGYHYVSATSQNLYTINSSYSTSTNTLTVSGIAHDDTIIVTVELDSFTVALIGGAGGTPAFEAGYTSSVYYGNSVIVNAGVNAGYRFNSWSLSGTGTLSNANDNPVTVSNIFSNITLTANYIQTFTLTLSVSGSGQVKINLGAYQSFVTEIFDVNTVVSISAFTDTLGQEFKRWNRNETQFSLDADTLITLTADTELVAVFGVIGYRLTFAIIGTGTVTCNSSTVYNNTTLDVVYGDDFVIMLSAPAGRYLSSVTRVALSGNDELTAQELLDALVEGISENDIAENVTYDIIFASTEYSVTLSVSTDVGTGGTATFADLSTTKQITIDDLPVSIFATALEGYRFVNWTVTGSGSIANETSATTTITAISSNLTITANFEILHYNFTVTFNDEFGTVSFDGTDLTDGQVLSVMYGEDLLFTFTSIGEQYFVDAVTLNGADRFDDLVNNTLTVSDVAQDYTLSVLFDIFKYDVTTDCDFSAVNIELWVNELVTADTRFAYGTVLTVKSTYAGFQFLSYVVNGVEYQNDNSTFTVTENTEIVGHYLAHVGGGDCTNGAVTINGLADGYFAYGDTVSVAADPDLGYRFSSWIGSYGSNDTFTLTIHDYATITANFVSKPVSVTISTNEFGSLAGSSANGTDYVIGDTITLRAALLYEGYEFLGWSGTYYSEFLSHLINTTYIVSPLDAEEGEISFYADIQILSFTVIIGSNSGGVLEPSGTFTFDYGYLLTLQLQAEPYHYLQSVMANDLDTTDQVLEDAITFTITEDLTISVTFAQILWSDYAEFFPSGNGTQNSPYVIFTAEELAYVSFGINEGLSNEDGLNYAQAYYRLMSDIDLADKYWTPIGLDEENKRFNGVFDFNFYGITNLMITNPNQETLYDGLFSFIGSGRVINQHRSYFTVIIVIVASVVLLGFAALAVILIEKRRRAPKKVFIVPKNFNYDQFIKKK